MSETDCVCSPAMKRVEHASHNHPTVNEHYVASKTVELGGVANTREPDLARTTKLMTDYLASLGANPDEWRIEITRPTRIGAVGTVALVTPSKERYHYSSPIIK